MTNAEQPMDHVSNDDGVAREKTSDLEKNVTEKSTWVRLLFMIVMGVAWSVAVFVTSVVVVVNFFYVLFTGKTNARLTEFGQALASYLYQIVRFMTFNTDIRPFPIDAEWPSAKEEI
jgi:Flp pilus assembly protein TadB